MHCTPSPPLLHTVLVQNQEAHAWTLSSLNTTWEHSPPHTHTQMHKYIPGGGCAQRWGELGLWGQCRRPEPSPQEGPLWGARVAEQDWESSVYLRLSSPEEK